MNPQKNNYTNPNARKHRQDIAGATGRPHGDSGDRGRHRADRHPSGKAPNGGRPPRESEDGFFVCGVHPVEETLAVLPATALGRATLWIADTRTANDIQGLLETARQKKLTVKSCPMEELDDRTGETRHQGVLLEVGAFPYADLDDVLERTESDKPLLVALDQIQDPHNLGAIIRSAAAFGALAVIIPKDRAAQITPTVLKTSAGQAWRVPICRVTNLAQTLRKLKDGGFTVFGADIEGDPLPSIHFDQPCVIVMGSEGDGMRRLTRTLCDQFARIEHNPDVESLNVSVAAAIFLYQASLSRCG